MMIISAAVMVAISLASHLGLLEAVAKVLQTIARCPKCSTFWTSLAVLLLMGSDPLLAAALSIISSYLSFWFGLLLIRGQQLYDKLWRRLETRSRESLR